MAYEEIKLKMAHKIVKDYGYDDFINPTDTQNELEEKLLVEINRLQESMETTQRTYNMIQFMKAYQTERSLITFSELNELECEATIIEG